MTSTPPKIIDCMTFYNELDLLTYRLNILNDVVDHFIIVESKYTHSGVEKPLFFNENKHLFTTFKEKIIHIILENAPFIYPNINYEQNEQWENEYYQRDMIADGLNQLTLQPTDLITITDLDEIPDPATLTQLKESNISVGSFEMNLYYYNLNTVNDILWNKAKIISYATYQLLHLSCTKIRHLNNIPSIKKGGWHLSYFGDSQFIQNKLKTFAHQEINKEEYTSLTNINHAVETGSYFIQHSYVKFKNISIKNNHYLPPKYDIYLQRFIQNPLEEGPKE